MLVVDPNCVVMSWLRGSKICKKADFSRMDVTGTRVFRKP